MTVWGGDFALSHVDVPCRPASGLMCWCVLSGMADPDPHVGLSCYECLEASSCCTSTATMVVCFCDAQLVHVGEASNPGPQHFEMFLRWDVSILLGCATSLTFSPLNCPLGMFG